MTSHTTRMTILVFTVTATVTAGPPLDLDWHTMDGGGGTSTVSDIALAGTIGQPDATVSVAGDFQLQGGFWLPTDAAQPACPADTDDSGEVDVNDLVAIIVDWGTDGSANNTDIDGNGIVNVDDLVEVILNWGICS